uniref:rhotekin-2-like n=1 Tax=Pristiophorus japonicus TaxID=55135 RepID=UPI00398F27C4
MGPPSCSQVSSPPSLCRVPEHQNETRIRATEKDTKRKTNSISITNQYAGEEVTHTLVSESREEMCQWMEAFWQHFCDMSAWKHCCDELMKIDLTPPRKPPVTISKQGASLYHEMAIDSPDDIDSVTDILSRRVQAIGAHGDAALPPWYVLFENTPKTVCRSVVPMSEGSVISDGDGSCTDRVQNCANTHQPVDSGSAKDWHSQDCPEITGQRHLSRPRTLSLDAKLTSLKCQAQRAEALSNKYAALLCPSSSETSSQSSSPESQVKAFSRPAPERQSWRNIRAKLDPRNWLQTQV